MPKPGISKNAISFISGGDVGVNAAAVANNIQAARKDPLFAVVGGDLGYPGLDKLHPHGHIPRRKPRGKPRPPEDVAYNQAFARQRVKVEHTIGEVRRFACLTQTDRHRRQHHTARVRAVAGLVYRRRHRHDRLRAA